jgi:maltose alpha-D-glucosyltransferase/alpha-amylase
VLASVREHDGETVLVVANLSHVAQAVQLDLAQFAGRTPFEMLGSTAFPPIATAPYMVTLGPYGFFWFSLARDPHGIAAPMRSSTLPELPTIVVPRGSLAFDAWARAVIDGDVVPAALGAAEHGHVIDTFVSDELDPSLAFVVVGEGRNRASLMLRFVWDAQTREDALARARSGPREGWIADAAVDATTAPLIERAMRAGTELSDEGRIAFAWEGEPRPDAGSSQRFGFAPGAQRWILDDARLVTLHRRMPRVENSTVAFLRHLREHGFTQAPQLFGTALVTDRSGDTWVAVTSQSFIQNPTDIEAALREILRTGTADERLIVTAQHVADALASLHRALVMPGSDPTFGTHPLAPEDVAGWHAAAHDDLAAVAGAGIASVADARERIAAAIDAMPRAVDAASARAHGRLTLSRVLLVDAVPVFVGFGEALARRSSPLKDVALLARSFDAVTRETIQATAFDPTAGRETARDTMLDLTARVREAFLARYAASASDLATTPRDPAQRDGLIRFFRLQSALRDVRDALAGRPSELAAAVDTLLAEAGAAE